MNIEQVKQRIDLLQHFDYSLALFESNYKELMSVINFMCDEKVGLELFAVVNRWKLYECQMHLGFKLHNYICAAKSLVDHSRVLYRRVYEKQLIKFDDYESEVKARFDNNSLSKFVEFLRTYAQHEKLPAVGSGFSFDSQSDAGFIFTVSLDSSELLKSSSIKSLPKKYIREQGDSIDIKLVLSTYHKQVCDFYDWVKERQNEIHNEDLRVLDDAYSKERKLATVDFVSSFPLQGHIGSVKEQLYNVLTSDDYKFLEQFSENESMWLEQALSLIEAEANEVIPLKIKAILREQCATEEHDYQAAQIRSDYKKSVTPTC